MIFNKLKLLLDSAYQMYLLLNKKTSPNFEERDIFWCNYGFNIGFEQNGGGEFLRRPVLVLKKFNKDFFLGIPLSTKIKSDNRYYYEIKLQEEKVSVILSQLRAMDRLRLDSYISRLNENDFKEIKALISKDVFV